MKSLKYSKNYQNVKQRYTVTKCCWKNGIYGLFQHRIATNLQFVKKKKIVSANHNRTRYAHILSFVCITLSHNTKV